MSQDNSAFKDFELNLNCDNSAHENKTLNAESLYTSDNYQQLGEQYIGNLNEKQCEALTNILVSGLAKRGARGHSLSEKVSALGVKFNQFEQIIADKDSENKDSGDTKELIDLLRESNNIEISLSVAYRDKALFNRASIAITDDIRLLMMRYNSLQV